MRDVSISLIILELVTNVFTFHYSQEATNDVWIIRWDIQRSTNMIYWETIITNASSDTNFWFETNNKAFYRVKGIK